MIKILANDGIHPSGEDLLEKAGFEVDTKNISKDELPNQLNSYDVLLVRSATKVRADLMDKAPNLKMIGRGGVGMDNIDVEYAKSKNIEVFNTPKASSQSVAELVIAHLLCIARSLYISNAQMPSKGDVEFKSLKKVVGKNGFELQGKTMGIFGSGRIGKATAQKAIALGMNVVFYNRKKTSGVLDISFNNNLNIDSLKYEFSSVSLDEFFKKADVISLHVPAVEKPLIGQDEISKMKDGVILINCARGGVVDESALASALDNGKVAYAGIDVFDKEPPVDMTILKKKNVSLSPHIGGSTKEAQERIGIELAEKIISFFKK
ncbi:MAG: Hydroxypyruvate reductase [Bacteroidetes bacterium MED-G17]|nr:MAG: Hydroxypyruvate reductase [Bacteroidetes bacterium MED-G17]